VGVHLLVDMAGKRARRDEWRARVDRWTDSGLTAKEFAAETGINAGTLQFWKYKLNRTPERGRPAGPAPALSSIVEVRPAIGVADGRFEIELGSGRRLLRVPASFDARALKALLTILDATT
jgi:hypothetical protein